MKGIGATLRSFVRDESGAMAMVVAPVTLVVFGMAALAVDTAQAFTTRAQLLTAAEAVAAASVSSLPDRQAARSMALAYAQSNARGAGTVVASADVEIGYFNKSTRTFTPKGDTEPVNAVRITASRLQAKGNAVPTIFGSVLGLPLFDLSVSVIAMRYDGQPCINALAPDGIGVKVNSNAAINTSTCPVHVHSTANNALSVDSNASVTAESICVKGGYELRSNATAQPTPETSCPAAAADPFANVVPPSFGASCTYTNLDLDGRTVTLHPGVYCGGIRVRGKSLITFSAGDYIIKDGPFTIQSNSRAVGSNVHFYMTGAKALLNFESNVSVTFTANPSGPRAGIVFFQDRAFGGVHDINSNVTAIINGAVYFPKGTLNLDSNSTIDTESACLMIVANRVNLDSNVTIDSNSNVKSATDSSLCPAPEHTRRSRIVS